jgi:hypothetical protein
MPTTRCRRTVALGAAILVMVLTGCASASSGHGEGDLATPAMRNIAMQLVSSAENPRSTGAPSAAISRTSATAVAIPAG